jgi:predicted Rossmann fold nucleotide-binding protein DprA/Smf involved in DNA uptake
MIKDAAYWIAFAHLPGWRYSRLNELLDKIYNEGNSTLEEFFSLSEKERSEKFDLLEKEAENILKSKKELPNHAFLAENLSDQGFELIPVISSGYSETLKNNFKGSYLPVLFYIKGNKKILNEKSVAIVGSRNANEISIKFTDNIAKKASKEFKAVVSGFAKGVDKQALNSAIKYKGQSIIVLPQGVLTFSSGYKEYYKQIVKGNVLVLSAYHPKAPWRAELAMARNSLIYGLADDIYVAESGETGGTWSGVIDGLKRRRTIFVRQPESNENNANDILIQKGAVAVDMSGDEIKQVYEKINDYEDLTLVKDSTFNLDEKIRTHLNGKSLSAKELKTKLNLDWSTNKLSSYLKKLPFIKYHKDTRSMRYIVNEQWSMFNGE